MLLEQGNVTHVAKRLELLVLDYGLVRTAGLLPGASLRRLHALHVAAAWRSGADAVMTFDEP